MFTACCSVSSFRKSVTAQCSHNQGDDNSLWQGISDLVCLSASLSSLMDHGPWGGKKAGKHLMTEGCSGLWSSPPPVKTWLPWPQLSYRLSAQPLIPLSGTRGSRNSAITVHLQLLGFTSLCVTGCSLLSSCLPPFFFLPVVSLPIYPLSSIALLILMYCSSPSWLRPHFSLLYPLLLVSHLAIFLSVCPTPLSNFPSYLSARLCKSSLIHSQ